MAKPDVASHRPANDLVGQAASGGVGTTCGDLPGRDRDGIRLVEQPARHFDDCGDIASRRINDVPDLGVQLTDAPTVVDRPVANRIDFNVCRVLRNGLDCSRSLVQLFHDSHNHDRLACGCSNRDQ